MAHADNGFRVPKMEHLLENTTITDFVKWQNNALYNLSLNNHWAAFLDTEWQKKSVANHGLEADVEPVAENLRKTAAQKAIQLDRMLGYIAQFAPSLLHNDITKNATSLSWIWDRIRKYFAFSRSEGNFLKLYDIRRKDNERYETLYQRILAHLEDNLLTTTCGLKHDGVDPTQNEEMSPLAERMAVYLWLQLIDQRLIPHTAKVYSHELQSMTLKDLQPRLSENMDTILQDMNTQEDVRVQYSYSYDPEPEDVHVQYSRTNYNQLQPRTNYNPSNRRQGPPQRRPPPRDSHSSRDSQSTKICYLCKAAGRQSKGHDVSGCYFTSKFEKMELAKALQVTVDGDCVDCEVVDLSREENSDASPISQVTASSQQLTSVRKVQCDPSPFFYAFHHHNICHVVVDSGATSSMVSRAFLILAGIMFSPTGHSARAVNKSPVTLRGEVSFTLHFNGKDMAITALVMDTLDCDVLAGTPFCKDHKVGIFCYNETISLGNTVITYGAKSKQPPHDIYRAESLILRSDQKNTVMPGEFIEYEHPNLTNYEGEISIEPHTDSPSNWPKPALTRVIAGRVRIPNNSDEPVKISKSQHFARIRRVISPEALSTFNPHVKQVRKPDISIDNASLISIDPDSTVMTPQEKTSFHVLHKEYSDVFDPVSSPYNDRSGRIRANVIMGPVPPPPRKGKVPLYSQQQLNALQDEADKLEEIGVLVRPEDIGVQVTHVSPSFLVPKPDGGVRLVTAFNELVQYVRIPPTLSRSCNDVLRQLSSWKFIIKCDLKKAFYQLLVAKHLIPYLGTVTPHKGLRVYCRAAMGMPGSSEALEELVSRVFGDLIRENFFIHIHDDIHICANRIIPDLRDNWHRVLQLCRENNVKLAPLKTFICPKQFVTLGWVWNSGTLSPSAHKTAAIASCEPPKTCTKLRSFIGGFKALSQCIPRYASLVGPLEDAIKGLNGSDHINWTPELLKAYETLQEAVKHPHTITMPRPSDQLVITTDASPLNNGISGTV